VEEIERKTEKFIKATPGIMAVLLVLTSSIAFLLDKLSAELFISGLVTPIVTFIVAQKGTQDAQKGTAAALGTSKPTNGTSAPPPTQPAPPAS
jgi:hypothetical protein